MNIEKIKEILKESTINTNLTNTIHKNYPCGLPVVITRPLCEKPEELLAARFSLTQANCIEANLIYILKGINHKGYPKELSKILKSLEDLPEDGILCMSSETYKKVKNSVTYKPHPTYNNVQSPHLYNKTIIVNDRISSENQEICVYTQDGFFDVWVNPDNYEVEMEDEKIKFTSWVGIRLDGYDKVPWETTREALLNPDNYRGYSEKVKHFYIK